MAFNSALGTVCNPPNAPLAPYNASFSDPRLGSTHAQPHLRSLLSLVLFPPDPSVKIVTFSSLHSPIGPNTAVVSNIGPDGIVSCLDTEPFQYNVRFLTSPLHLLYSAQNLLDYWMAGCLFSCTFGHSQNRWPSSACWCPHSGHTASSAVMIPSSSNLAGDQQAPAHIVKSAPASACLPACTKFL